MLPASTLLLLAHAATTLAMTGIIWFVQLVHYPLLRDVGHDAFARAETSNFRRTRLLVSPLMAVEGVTAALLLCSRPPTVSAGQVLTGLALLGATWLSTLCIQLPIHRRLRSGPDAAILESLILTNWIRTGAWSLRAALVLLMLTHL